MQKITQSKNLQNFEIGRIQFNNIFIQQESVGIGHPYSRVPPTNTLVTGMAWQEPSPFSLFGCFFLDYIREGLKKRFVF